MFSKHPGQVPELQNLMRIVAERSRRNQPVRALRPLTLICGGGQGHTIGRVYVVPAGPVLVGERPLWDECGTEWVRGTATNVDPETGEEWEYDVAREVGTHEIRHRFETVAVVLSEQRYESDDITLQCKCRTVRLTLMQLRELLAEGRPRVRVGVTVLGHSQAPAGRVHAEVDDPDNARV